MQSIKGLEGYLREYYFNFGASDLQKDKRISTFTGKCKIRPLHPNSNIFQQYDKDERKIGKSIGLNLSILHQLRNKFSELILSRSRCLLPV